MAPYAAQGVLVLFAMNLGIGFGAGLYELRIVFPQWLETTTAADGSKKKVWNTDAVLRFDVGKRFWAFIGTGPLTLLTLTSAYMAPKVGNPSSQFWLMAVTITIIERMMTFTYFIPTMISLGSQPGVVSDPKVIEKAERWGKMNFVRLGLSFAGWFLAMQAVLNYQRSEGLL